MEINRGDIKPMAKEDHGRPIRKPLFLRLDEELRHQLVEKARDVGSVSNWRDQQPTSQIVARLR